MNIIKENCCAGRDAYALGVEEYKGLRHVILNPARGQFIL